MCTKKQTGFRIRNRRKELGMTLEDVCQLVDGLSVSRLSNWEQGRNMVGVEVAKKLALILNISAAYILTIEDDLVDETERALLKYYRSADARGQKCIIRVARDESATAQEMINTPGSVPQKISQSN